MVKGKGGGGINHSQKSKLDLLLKGGYKNSYRLLSGYEVFNSAKRVHLFHQTP
jgi:hypothetical protein